MVRKKALGRETVVDALIKYGPSTLDELAERLQGQGGADYPTPKKERARIIAILSTYRYRDFTKDAETGKWRRVRDEDRAAWRAQGSCASSPTSQLCP